MAGQRLADDVERQQSGSITVGKARSVKGIPVHGRIVVRGHIDGRDDVFGQHASEGAAQRDALGGCDGYGETAYDGLRHGNGQRIRIMRREAAGNVVGGRHQ